MVQNSMPDGPLSARRPSRVLGTVAIAVLMVVLTWQSAVRPGGADERPPDAPCGESIPDIFDRVSPAVVYIAATSINPYRLSDRVTRVVGSGLIIDSAGLVLTNSHVAFGRQSIRVTLDDSRSSLADLVGADPIFDLAVLRLTELPEGRLPVATLGNSDKLRVGEEVLAIGNPLRANPQCGWRATHRTPA